jgi:parvulin-like peptidyl-prolyl isomerase
MTRVRVQFDPSRFKRILDQPLVHFLVAGAVILALSAIWQRSQVLGQASDRIVIPAARIQQFRDTWIAQWGQAPSPQEMQTLIEDYEREEILYRDAIASNLDKDDAVIRRRLAQKVEFLAQSVASATDPSEADLTQFFAQHRAQYAIAPTVAFVQVYFSTQKRGLAAERHVQDTLNRLRGGRVSDINAATLGDSSMLQHEYPLQTKEQVRALFGDQFATTVFQLNPGRWEGPVTSSYGTHLVRILRTEPGQIPTLADLRSAVVMDFKEARLRSAVDAYYQKLRSRYRFDVDMTALSAARQNVQSGE